MNKLKSQQNLDAEKQWLLSKNTRDSKYKLEWVDEAIQQVEEFLAGNEL